jgi:SAM-dependent methyltransferase
MTESPYQDKNGPWSSHTFILERLRSLPAGSRVLDVGAATGMLARRSGNASLEFFGIEVNPEWARLAEPYYREMWTCSLEDIPETALGGFDAIVLGDVLEHLPRPEEALSKLSARQTRGSLFIISVPNVANIWIRLNLLFGKFTYTDRGLLDRMHLHFFTRRGLLDMTRQAGLEIGPVKTIPVPLDLISPFFATSPGRWLQVVLNWFTSLFPTLLGYQFILEAMKP